MVLCLRQEYYDRKERMMIKKISVIVSIILGISILTGCGEKEELTKFQEDISQFYAEVTALENEIATIDEEAEEAVDTLINYMEEMALQFHNLAEIEVPQEFVSIEELAEDASSYMDEAVRLYSEAYEEDYVSDSLIQAASENYESAMKRVNYIAVLLQGEIPEGATVVESDGTEFEPYIKE